MSRARDEKRAQHQRYKEDVERRGKPFYPYAMFHDTVMSLVVVSVIIGLAVVWRYSIPDGSDGTEPGLLGPLYSEEADPGTTSFIPRPDWYFYFLFYLLRIFQWPESVVLGTVGIPTVLLILLIALPFLDLRRERRLLRRPVAVVALALTALSMGVLTYKGATARESLGSEAVAAVDTWMTREQLPQEAREGAEIFAQVGCLNCHTYLGTGNSVGPELTEEGNRNRGLDWQVGHMKNPPEYSPGSSMPSFAGLGDENLRKIAVFLEASKGEQGS